MLPEETRELGVLTFLMKTRTYLHACVLHCISGREASLSFEDEVTAGPAGARA